MKQLLLETQQTLEQAYCKADNEVAASSLLMYLHFFQLGIQGSKVGLYSCQLSLLLVQACHELAVLPFSSRQLLLLWCHHLCNSAAQFQPQELSHDTT